MKRFLALILFLCCLAPLLLAFPTTGVLDTFTRANENPLANGNWTCPWYPASDNLKIVSNAAVINTGYSTCYWSASAFTAKSEAFVTVATKGNAATALTLALRLTMPNNAALTCYELYVTPVAGGANDVWQVYRGDDSGHFVQLGADITQEFASGDSVGISANGSTLEVWYKTGGTWSSLGTRTDATYSASGYIGLGATDASWGMTNFGGGSIPVGSHGLLTMGVGN